MQIGDIPISTEGFSLIVLALLYAPVVWICYRRLMPRLAPAAWRLATSMLAAQVLVLLLSLGVQTSSKYARWLWDFHEEWNIPSTYAAVQLAVVGGVALLTGCFAKPRAAWRRLYLVGIGLVFLFLAVDEFLALHESIHNWGLRYLILGTAIVLATLALALRSPRATLKWHICLLAGLAMSAAGEIFVNELSIPHDVKIGALYLDDSLEFYILEEMMGCLGIWLTLVAMLGHFSSVALAPSRALRRLLYALPALGLAALLINALLPRLELPLLARPAAVRFESGLQLHGYRIDRWGPDALLRLYVSASQEAYMGLGYSVHLVDQVSGQSVASRDEWADRQHGIWLFGPEYAPLFRQWMYLNVPPESPTNRAYWIVLTLWRKKHGAFVRQKVLDSDLQLLSETQVVLGELVLPAPAAGHTSPPLVEFDNGFMLEAVTLPPQARAGETLRIPITWRSAENSREDHAQFLHFGHEESGAWWVFDQEPLGSRLPTRLWYTGLSDSEIWEVPLPTDLAAGSYAVYTGLYRKRDKERVIARDANGARFLDAYVPLGSMLVTSDA